MGEVKKLNPESKGTQTPEPTKLSYEQLNQAANQIAGQYKQSMQEIEQLKQQLARYNRLDYLMGIAHSSDKFPSSLVEKVHKEIENAFYPTISENVDECTDK